MTIYDTKNTQLIWCAKTLEGFGNQKICVTQNSETSFRQVVGIFGEYFFSVNPERSWTISSTFLANSESYKLLEWHNLLHIEGILIIRDLNLNTSDVFYDCVISSVSEKVDSNNRKVIWTAVKRDFL